MHSSASIPTATYRLQFHQGFTFQQASELVPYLHALGVSHLYSSPFFRATPGSLHGYDVCDHNAFNPEIGTREEFNELAAALQSKGMGQILDFVPNHMGIGESTNQWWMDVLENGPSSPYARYFDIEWHPLKRELANKVLLPILGDQYGRVLEQGDIKVEFAGGKFSLNYQGRTLPLAPRTVRSLLNHAKEILERDRHEAAGEIASILFSIEHLPPPTETNPAKIAERTRESDMVKTRLARLCDSEAKALEAIMQAVTEIQQPDMRSELDTLINAQSYRLAYWRVAAEEINYRRFFDINNLAAIRMDLPEVFDATHKLAFEMLASGAAIGLRIDHIDGLSDPRGYLAKLQEAYAQFSKADPAAKPLYLLVEKILGRGEQLRQDWPVHGTTGYEMTNQLTGVLVDSAAETAFSEAYARFVKRPVDYAMAVYQSKLLVMRISMSSEVNVLGHMLNRISETNPWYRDFTLNSLTTAIREVIACFPVYRTYFNPDTDASEQDVRVVKRALALARRRNPAFERTVFEFLRHVLIPPADNPHPVSEGKRRRFVTRFQQCTGPITAKGVEDTAFYRYHRLIALNEVGGEPDVFGVSVDAFHQYNALRLASFPHSLIATTTHDTKRSEDVRARLAALSEMSQDWVRAVRRWHTANRKHRQRIDDEQAPDRNEEYLLYQTLLGSWPLFPMTDLERGIYIRRIQDYMLKAGREAKINTSWTEPNEGWDKAVESFVEKVITPVTGNRFLQSFEPMVARVAELGMVNSLAQTVLKLTVPGVPDIYQGQELWDFSLVDPDNRRPVDYALRAQMLEGLKNPPPAEELLRDWRDGRIKMLITQKLLLLRREHPELFQTGTYTGLKAEGEFSECCIAFEREHVGRRMLVIVPRLSSRVGTPPIGDCWRGTRLSGLQADGEWTNVLTNEIHTGSAPLELGKILRELPVAVLINRPES